jgi:hypothetical protein
VSQILAHVLELIRTRYRHIAQNIHMYMLHTVTKVKIETIISRKTSTLNDK